MCAARECGLEGLPGASLLIGKDGYAEELSPVKTAVAVLEALVEEMISGLASPLPFSPQAGWAWFEATRAAKEKADDGEDVPPETPNEKAQAAYDEEPSGYSFGGDGRDPYIALCFRGVTLLSERRGEFERLAAVLFGSRLLEGVGA
jgi:exonuclease V gamma subunit